MHVLLIPFSLIVMAFVGHCLRKPWILGKLWWRFEGWLNGDPSMEFYDPALERYEAAQFWAGITEAAKTRGTERFPMCPGEGCPHQTAVIAGSAVECHYLIYQGSQMHIDSVHDTHEEAAAKAAELADLSYISDVGIRRVEFAAWTGEYCWRYA